MEEPPSERGVVSQLQELLLDKLVQSYHVSGTYLMNNTMTLRIPQPPKGN